MAAKTPTVLLVEDERMLAEMYSTKFAMEGWTVVKAFDGAEGLAAARKSKPDIILLDIIMPRMDGFAALKELKADPKLQGVPVVLLTNLGQDDDVAKGKKLGATDYFVKADHTPAEVVDKVKQTLGVK